MKKTRVLGVALTLAATMAVGGAMGQDVEGGADFVKVGATDGDASNHRSFITIGKTLGFYAEPDLAFHTGYNAGAGWKLVTDFEWNWDLTGAVGVTPVKGPALTPAKAANYVELTSSSIGVKTIVVREKSSAAFGGCEDATGKSFDLVVLDKPVINFISDLATTTGKRPLTETCGDVNSWTVKLAMSVSDFVSAKFKLEEFPVTISAAGAAVVGAVRSKVDYNTNKLAAGATYTHSATDKWTLDGAAFNYDTDNVNRTLNLTQTRKFVVNTNPDGNVATNDADVITLYRYTIVDGVSDFVSRKSDNKGTETFYAGTGDQTIDIYVKRAPKTGPVYHINNNIAK